MLNVLLLVSVFEGLFLFVFASAAIVTDWFSSELLVFGVSPENRKTRGAFWRDC